MIAPIREAEPTDEPRTRASGDVRRLVASLFLDDVEHKCPAPAVPRWKAWLLIGWATAITLLYFAAMLNFI